MKSLFLILVLVGCGGVSAVENDADPMGAAGAGGGAGTTGAAGTTGQGGSGGAAVAGAGGEMTAGAGGGAQAGTTGMAGTTGAGARGGGGGAGTGGAPMPYCAWAQPYDANGTGMVTAVVAQTNTSACLSAASNYKSQHPQVPVCQGVISNASGSAFDSMDIVSPYPSADGTCELVVNTTVPILVAGGTCVIMVTSRVFPAHPTMQVRNPPPPCS